MRSITKAIVLLLVALSTMGSSWFFVSTGFTQQKSGVFDGSSYADGGNVSALDIDANANPFWISVWAKTDSLSTFAQLVTKRDKGGTERGYEIGMDTSGDIVTELVAGGGADKIEITWNTNITTGQWHHYCWKNAGTGDVAGSELWVDGTEITDYFTVSTSLSGTTQSSAPFRIGARNTGLLPWTGKIDEVIYGSGDTDCTTLFNSGMPKTERTRAGVISWYRFETGISPVDDSSNIYDRKGSNHLTNTTVTYSTDIPLVTFMGIASFNGTNSYVDFVGNFDWEYTQPWTVNAWVNLQYQDHGGAPGFEAQQDTFGNASSTCSGEDCTDLLGWRAVFFGSGIEDDLTMCPAIQLFHKVSPGSDHRAEIITHDNVNPCTVPLNTWKMVTWRNSGNGHPSGLKVSVDGVTVTPLSSIDTLGGESIVTGLDAWLGRISNQTGGSFYYVKGDMTGISYWEAYLSDDDVLTLYNSGKFVNVNNVVPARAGDLVGQYPVNYGGSLGFKDGSGNGNDGTPHNVTYSYPP